MRDFSIYFVSVFKHFFKVKRCFHLPSFRFSCTSLKCHKIKVLKELRDDIMSDWLLSYCPLKNFSFTYTEYWGCYRYLRFWAGRASFYDSEQGGPHSTILSSGPHPTILSREGLILRFLIREDLILWFWAVRASFYDSEQGGSHSTILSREGRILRLWAGLILRSCQEFHL